MKIDLQGRTAVICGSTQGIGRAIALQMADAGAKIILVARNEEKLKVTLNQLNEISPIGHAYYQADFNDTHSVQQAVKSIADSYQIDILVNNTGGPPGGAISDATTDAFDTAFRQHLVANHIMVQHLLPGMKNRRFGRIINIISTSVKIPLKGLGVSNTIRGAVANWSKTLAGENASFGITVNNILPGATETERLKNIITGKSSQQQVERDEIEKEMLEEIPAGRFAKPEEPAYAAVFLASEQAAYITGTNIVVDGGRTGSL